MDFVQNLQIGMDAALSPEKLLFCFIGTLIGTLVGVLPGIGPVAAVAILLPSTYLLDPLTGIIMLAGIYYGAQYGGSTTAILMNVPGESSSAVTSLEGFQMARRGRAGAALAAAAIGSFVAGTIGTLLIAFAGPALTQVALRFGPPEYFALIVIGLIITIVLARGSVLKALAMAIVGLLLGVVGTDIYTGARRFTMGLREMQDGIEIVSLSVGLFGLTEILRTLEGNNKTPVLIDKIGALLPTKQEIKRMIAPIFRGTALGSALGVLPGGGLVLATFASYAMEKKLTRHRDEFGQGAVEGVAGPEAANNAAAQTSFIPMLSLGLPAHPVMALILGALIVQGITPGPRVISDNPELFWGLIVSMWVGNLFLVVLNLPLVGLWVKLLRVPYYIIVPAILLFSAVGIHTIGVGVIHIVALSVFGGVGYLLLKLDCEPAPLLLGFILGPLLEEHLRRSLLLSRGSIDIFFNRPVSAALLILAIVLLVLALLPVLQPKRDAIFEE